MRSDGRFGRLIWAAGGRRSALASTVRSLRPNRLSGFTRELAVQLFSVRWAVVGTRIECRSLRTRWSTRHASHGEPDQDLLSLKL